MKKIKVLLADPRHHTVGACSPFVPINLGYIATYMLKFNGSQKFDIKISIDPDEIFDLLDKWNPNIFASSNYIWI